MELAGKVALVTGVSGFIGSRVARRLLQEGMHVRGLFRRAAESNGVSGCIGDIASGKGLAEAAEGADLIVHCAAMLFGDEEQLFAVNVGGTERVLASAIAARCPRFIHLSTAAVYDFPARDLVDETTPFRQDGNAYQLSKVETERVVWTVAQQLAVTVLRPHVVLGVHPTAAWSAVLARRMLKGEFVLHGDGGAVLPCVHVDNLADAVVLAARSGVAVGRVYNLVDGHTTIRQYAEWIRHCLSTGPLTSRPELPVWRGRLDGSRAVRELGYVPRVSYPEALAEMKKFLRPMSQRSR